MLTVRSVVVAVLLATGGATAFSQPAPPPPTAGPARVTTDTPEYCDVLAERVARAEQLRPDSPRQVEELAQEGHSMCAVGLIRGGLVRLRRALLMLRNERSEARAQ